MAGSPSEQAEDALERTKRVFRFLKAFAERNMPAKRALAEQPWVLRLCDLPSHPAIALGTTELEPQQGALPATAESSDPLPLIRVRRPRLTSPPAPPAALSGWVVPGWEKWGGHIAVTESRNVVGEAGDPVVERFDSDVGRVEALRAWRAQWQAWFDAERPARDAQEVFDRFYQLRGWLQLEGENVELMLGDGRLRWALGDTRIDHPVLLQRVEVEFDPRIPEFRVIDSDRLAELYTPLLHVAEGLTGEQIVRMQRELEAGGYHPLGRKGTSGFLRQLAALLSARSDYRDEPSNERLLSDPVVSRDPVLFARSRAFGLPAALDRVLEDLDQSPVLPFAIMRAVGVEPPIAPFEEQHALSPWCEPVDVLLSKPANSEQIQIAHALERHRAVLVQGPPGTGKSHTIANLIGHLVAEGKRILITAHTTKALRVLRNQVVDPLKPLCVAVLDNDLESRDQLEQAVRGIVSRLTAVTDEGLSSEIRAWSRTREALLEEITQLASQLRLVREGEYLPISIAGEQMAPVEAAREVARGATDCSWLPGPLEAGAPLPLSLGEVLGLYGTNTALAASEERELGEPLPQVSELPSAAQLREDIMALTGDEPTHLARLWERDPDPATAGEIEQLSVDLKALAFEIDEMNANSWQLVLVSAGHAGGSEPALWRTLATHAQKAFEVWESSRELILEHAPEIGGAGEDISLTPELLAAIREILSHVEQRGALGTFTLVRRPRWRRVVRLCRVGGESPTLRDHFVALAALVELGQLRQKLAGRWARQAVPAGLPSFDTMPDPPEPSVYHFVAQFDRLLDWWSAKFNPIHERLNRSGFRWSFLRSQEAARNPPRPAFEIDRDLLTGVVLDALSARAASTRRKAAEERLQALRDRLGGFRGPVCSSLRSAVEQYDPESYRQALDTLEELQRKAVLRQRRATLLLQLEAAAPAWAKAVRDRLGPHDLGAPPGDVERAWRWRQLHQELERRADLDEISLTRRLASARTELREATATLIDRKAWLAQLRRTDLVARQALVGWLDTIKKIGKGTGRRAPELRVQARRLLEKARDAVPVWIMPLSRVAESFDPRHGRFDVVVVDEASQADLTGLLAWYLGDRLAIVGDDEQVSPLAVGQLIDSTRALISEHLHGIPNSHLYDGKTSIYDLAKQSFGGAIALREHFRCVPDIIEFSNHLSYGGQIRPLRDPASAPLPHVIEYMVPPELGSERSGKENLTEARVIAALVRATCEQAEYAGKTMGAITLLGDEQAQRIQQLVVSLIGAVDLEQRRFVAGNSAQFQGDERDVIWLSMVDVPMGAPLRLVDSQPMKQRFNVAASRAKDQLWLVHSLDPMRDLQEGDLRRRLIEHSRDPGARRRALHDALMRAESPFEQEVLRRLIELGYRVVPQVEAGHYRIDLVVTDGREQVAVECDGDRFHAFERIPEDMARQAVLERAGWRFVRVRGTRFYRNPQATMTWLVSELDRLGVRPAGAGAEVVSAANHVEMRDRVIRRAWEIMREQGWTPGVDAA
jgi:very-short-patch-repair endonuclease